MKATIGLKMLMVGLLQPLDTYQKFSNTDIGGEVIGMMMTASQSTELATSSLYADDRLVDSISEFASGTLSIGSASLNDIHQAGLLGHEYDPETGITFNTEDEAPFVGVGYYCKARDVNITPPKTVWVAKFYHRCKFAEPSDDANTKGDSPEYVTPTIEGTVYALANGDWKKQRVCDTEDEAIEFLKKCFGNNSEDIITPMG